MRSLLDYFLEMLGQLFVVILFIFWAFGGFIGAIYWAAEDELLDVVLSIFVPGYGALSVIWDLVT